MKIYWTKINKIIKETDEVITYMLDCPEGFTWEEGAHTHLALKGFNEGNRPNRGLVRHMSIMTMPYEQTIGITTRIKEKCSEYKARLKKLNVRDEVALFKTYSNVPLERKDKNIYLLSQGVGIATFRPLVLEYLNDSTKIPKVFSLNVDSSKDYLFTDLFKSKTEKSFTSQFVSDRTAYYEGVRRFAKDQEGLFYVVGSDEFIKQNAEELINRGINQEQILLDKHKQEREELLSFALTT